MRTKVLDGAHQNLKKWAISDTILDISSLKPLESANLDVICRKIENWGHLNNAPQLDDNHQKRHIVPHKNWGLSPFLHIISPGSLKELGTDPELYTNRNSGTVKLKFGCLIIACNKFNYCVQ